MNRYQVCVVVAALVVVGSAAWCSGQESGITLGGFFEAEVEVTQSSSICVNSVLFNTVLGLGEWLASADAQFAESQFETFSLYVAGPLGDIGLSSTLLLDPSALAFESWQSTAAFQLFDLSVSNVLFVSGQQTTSYNLLTLSAPIGPMTVQGKVKMGICPFSFWEGGVCVSGPWASCDVGVQACLVVTDLGFGSLTGTMTNLVLFDNFLGIAGTLDASVSFSVDDKAFTPTLKMTPDWPICVDVKLLGEVSVSDEPLSVDTALVYGLVGELSLDNGITFTFGDSFREEKNSAITGKAEYWQVFQIDGPLLSCCAESGGFEFATYFGGETEADQGLMGVGLFTAAFDIRLFELLSIAFEGEYPAIGTGWAFTVTLRVFW